MFLMMTSSRLSAFSLFRKVMGLCSTFPCFNRCSYSGRAQTEGEQAVD